MNRPRVVSLPPFLAIMLAGPAHAATDVVVLRADVPTGAALRTDDLGVAVMDERFVAETALHDVADGVGRVAREALYAGDVLRAERLAPRDAGDGVKPLLPTGMLGFVVPVDPRLQSNLVVDSVVDLWRVRPDQASCVLVQATQVLRSSSDGSSPLVVLAVTEARAEWLRPNPSEALRVAIRNPINVESRSLPSCEGGKTKASATKPPIPRPVTVAPPVCTSPEGTTSVVAAVGDLYPGVPIEAGDLKTVELSCAVVPAGAFANEADLVGTVPIRRVLAFEPVRIERLFRDDPTLPSTRIPSGERWVLVPEPAEACPAGTTARSVAAIPWSSVGKYFDGKVPKAALPGCVAATGGPASR